jgi:putative membrane protein
MTATTPDLTGAPQPRKGFLAPRWLVYTLGGLVILAVGFVVGRRVGRNHDRGRFDGPGRFGEHHTAAGRGLGLLVAIVVLVLVVAAIVALVRHFSAAKHEGHEGAASAERVLADRFARGEIDEAEFLRRRAALRT